MAQFTIRAKPLFKSTQIIAARQKSIIIGLLSAISNLLQECRQSPTSLPVIAQQKNGLIKQWSTESGTQTAGRTISFLINFTKTPAVGCSAVSNEDTGWCAVSNISTSGLKIREYYYSNNVIYNNGTTAASWEAIGY